MRSAPRRSALVAAAMLAVGPMGCGEAAPPTDPPSSTVAEPAAPAARPTTASAAAPVDTTPLADPCIRGGTPRANVGRIMGEPDSVVYGSWFFGASEVLFGYGVVVEIRDRGELILCDPA